MKIYLIVIMDRHYDSEIYPRYDKLDAIEEAEMIAFRRSRQHNYSLEEIEGVDTYYCGQYSCEGDCVYVVDAELK